MSIDVDRTLRDHAAAAAETDPAPDGWERLVARLDEEPLAGGTGAGGRRRAGDRGPRRAGAGRGPLVLAAAVLVVVAVSAAVALVRASDGPDGREATADAGPTTEPAPAPETTAPPGGTERPEVDLATRPERILAVVDHDDDGHADLVALDGIGIYEEETSSRAGLNRAPEVSELVGGLSVAPAEITSVDVGPDGEAYVAIGEEVWRVDPDTAAMTGPIAEGTIPAISGDGRTLATREGVDIRLHDLATGETTTVDHLKVFDQETTALALSPDGRTIARQRVTTGEDGTVVATAVEVKGVDDAIDAWVEVERSSGVALPAFMPDGHLAVGLGAWGASEGRTEARASGVGMADLATGDVRLSVEGGGFSFRAFDATVDGRWVLVLGEGVARAFVADDGWLWDSGTMVQMDGLVDVAW